MDNPLPAKRQFPVLRRDKKGSRKKQTFSSAHKKTGGKKKQTIIQRSYAAFQPNFVAFYLFLALTTKKSSTDAQTLSSMRNLATYFTLAICVVSRREGRKARPAELPAARPDAAPPAFSTPGCG
ncbi:hypothetical protein E2R62_13860 [Citrobacter rodentium]|uniref:Uncharacterized protein n=1 Tax=Citrobacter rodentium TaxID=67825 RepID=A0A482PP54_CITRO|nr:hypothetical protein E2R62_13860 [Citrobacter rodentium]